MSKKLTTLLITGILALSLTACGEQPQQPAPQNNQNQNPPPTTLTTTNTTVYAIKLDDNGTSPNSVQVGCGDSAMPVQLTTTNAYDPNDPVASINWAMMTLLNTNTTSFNTQGYENPLANQAMTIQSVDNTSGLIVNLNGTFTFGGVCEMPRVRAQVEETIKKAALGNATTIVWNGDSANWDKAFNSK